MENVIEMFNKENATIEVETTEKADIFNLEKGTINCKLKDILFDVELIDNPVKTNSEYSKIVVGHKRDETMHLNYCSPRYELVKNADIFPNIENVLNMNGIAYKAHYSHINYVRFYADINIIDKRFRYDVNGKGDYVYPKLMIQHSYNGLTKYSINFGYFRVVCSNGLVIPIKEMEKFNLSIQGKHTESILKSVSKLNEVLHYFTENAEQITNSIVSNFDALGGRMVANVEERIAEVLNGAKINIVENKKMNTVQRILDVIESEKNNPEMAYNGAINDWLIYNGINQYIHRNSESIEAPEKKYEKDSRVLEFMLAEIEE